MHLSPDPEGEPLTSTLLKPHLGELTVMDTTPDSLHLSWTVPKGQFDHFLIQYKNGDGHSKAVRVPGHEDRVTISGLELGHKYKMNLYGFHGGQRVGPVSAVGSTGEYAVPAPAGLSFSFMSVFRCFCPTVPETEPPKFLRTVLLMSIPSLQCCPSHLTFYTQAFFFFLSFFF